MSKNEQITQFTDELLPGIVQLIENAKQKSAIFLNAETTLLYWSIGNHINENLKQNDRLAYGGKILVTLSQHFRNTPLRVWSGCFY